MAKVQVDGYKVVKGAPFSNQKEIIRRTYDFSLDAGALADEYTLVNFSDACAVRLIGISVETAFTSAGAATIDCGLAGGTGTEFLNAEGKASFSAGAFVAGVADYIAVAAGEDIEMDIGTAALTAGKGEFIFEYIRA
jgi:hypothetical protein